MSEPWDVGRQRVDWSSLGFGDDYLIRVCWRCRKSETAEPLETCKRCREELIDG